MGILTEEGIEFCTELFNEVDADKSGSIDKNELETALTKLAEKEGFDPPSKEQIDQRMEMLDTTGDGTVNLEEFLQFAAIMKVMMICVMMFDAADADGSGSIDKGELKVVLTNIYEKQGEDPPTDEQVGEWLTALDQAGDGTISFEEFASFIIPVIIESCG
mmetsp:Transcript_5536/g.7981  ORF Transcript_5536/g.7981 Transcript_5536/m.7981 type:complete len:161 (-) Transcript_5536:45-527(-)